MLAVNVNPTIDRQVFVSELIPGTVSRAGASRALPGGKAVDSARAALAHGARVTVALLLPADPADWFCEQLRAEGLAIEVEPCPGTIRETIAVYEGCADSARLPTGRVHAGPDASDPGTGRVHAGPDDSDPPGPTRVTIINGAGEPTPPQVWTSFCARVAGLVRPGEWALCSGSYPPGAGAAQIAELFEAITAAGGLVAADSGPVWLAAVMDARPALVSPNVAEARSFLSGEPAVEDVSAGPDALAQAGVAAQELVRRGAERAIVSAGAAGLAWADADSSGTVPIVPVPVVNPAGAGDALLGGVLARLEAGDRFADAVVWGAATAASAITQWVPGKADRAQLTRFHHALRHP